MLVPQKHVGFPKYGWFPNDLAPLRTRHYTELAFFVLAIAFVDEATAECVTRHVA